MRHSNSSRFSQFMSCSSLQVHLATTDCTWTLHIAHEPYGLLLVPTAEFNRPIQIASLQIPLIPLQIGLSQHAAGSTRPL